MDSIRNCTTVSGVIITGHLIVPVLELSFFGQIEHGTNKRHEQSKQNEWQYRAFSGHDKVTIKDDG